MGLLENALASRENALRQMEPKPERKKSPIAHLPSTKQYRCMTPGCTVDLRTEAACKTHSLVDGHLRIESVLA